MMEAHARDSAALCSWAAMMEQQVGYGLISILMKLGGLDEHVVDKHRWISQ